MACISKKQAEDYFKCCDSTGDGKVSVQELAAAVRQSNCYPDDQIAQMFLDVDKNQDGTISFDEFLNEVTAQPRSEAIKQFFKEADSDGTGNLNRDELDRMLSRGDCPIKDPDSVRKMFDLADADGSGCIDKNEFEAAMSSNF